MSTTYSGTFGLSFRGLKVDGPVVLEGVQTSEEEPEPLPLAEWFPQCEGLLRSKHRPILPTFEEFGVIGKTETRLIDFTTDQCRDFYENGLLLSRQAREWHVGAELIARHSKGRYTSHHGACHSLPSNDTPCKGYENWILWYVAGILAPGFHGKIANPMKGGATVEHTLRESLPSGKHPRGILIPRKAER